MTTAQLDSGRIVGHGVVTKWTPQDLDRKLSIERDLIFADGLEGAALEAAALEVTEPVNPCETTGCGN